MGKPLRVNHGDRALHGNSKSQTPSSKQITNSKLQISNGNLSFEYFGLWMLGVVWDLVFGDWSFRIAFRAMRLGL